MTGITSLVFFLCTLLSMVLTLEALHRFKVDESQEWNPFDVLRPKKDDEANADSNADFQEVQDEIKGEIQRVSQNGDEVDEEDEVNKKDDARESILPKPAGDPIPPRMLVSGGCDGSGSILRHAHHILRLHGIQTPAVNKDEHAVDYGDIAQEGPGMGISGTARAMQQRHKDFLKLNQTFLFKGTIGTDQEAILSQDLFNLGTKVAEVVRRNEIDQVVCMIKDCFGTHMGHPVMGGHKSDLCMKRRKDNPMDYKAFVKTETLVRNIRKLEENVRNTTKDLKKMGYTKMETFSAEDLLDFEWDKDKVNTALPNWKHLLRSWGVNPSKTKIHKYLEENAGNRTAPPKHSDTIYNFGAVKGALKGHVGLLLMLRE